MTRSPTDAGGALDAAPASPSGCPVCGGERLSFLGRGARSSGFARCLTCGLFFQRGRARTDASRALYSTDYFRLREGGTGGWDTRDVAQLRRQSFEYHLAEIEKVAAKGVLVDVGCGEGFLLEVARGRGWRELHGVDVAPTAVERAGRYGTICQGDLVDARLPSAIADVVTFVDSFEHLWNPLGELREAYRVLKPGGIVYIVTPNAAGLLARLMGGAWFQIKPDEHVRLYSTSALRQLLTRSGWSDIAFKRAGKYSSLSFVTTILATTNPLLARLVALLFGWTPVWRSLWFIPSGDLRATARRPTEHAHEWRPPDVSV